MLQSLRHLLRKNDMLLNSNKSSLINALTSSHHQQTQQQRNYAEGLSLSVQNSLKIKADLKEKRAIALLGGGQKRIDAQHKKGKL